MSRKEDGVFSLSLTEIAFTLILLLVMLLGMRLYQAHGEIKKQAVQATKITAQLEEYEKELTKYKEAVENFKKAASDLGGLCKPDPNDPIEAMMPCTKCVSVISNISKKEASRAIALGTELLKKWRELSKEDYEKYENQLLSASKDLAEGKQLVDNRLFQVAEAKNLTLQKEVEELRLENERLEVLSRQPEAIQKELALLQERNKKVLNELDTQKAQLAENNMQLETLRNQNKALARRAGFDYPPCWVSSAGKIQYMLDVELLPDDKVMISKAWPVERDSDALAMEPVRKLLPLMGSPIEMHQFMSQAQRILALSNEAKPSACRHFVVLRNQIQDRKTGDRQRLKVENYFYKREVISKE